MFSCKFCEIFKNTFFTEHLRATNSEHSKTKLNWIINLKGLRLEKIKHLK